MAMTTISTAAFFERSNRDMAALRAQAESLQAAIGSGQRLAKGSDDPLAAARLRTLARNDSFAAIDATTAAAASGDLTLADGALSTFASYVTRIQELTIRAANGVVTTSQRVGIAEEIDQLRGELFQLANTRDTAGHALFGGETSGNAYTRDAAGNPVYSGTANAGELALGDGQSISRGVTGPEFLSFTSGGVATDLFTVTKALTDALRGGAADPAQAARDALGALKTGLDSITTAQTIVGARLNWIDLAGERRTQLAELRTEQEAQVGGTDIGSAISQLQQTMTVLEASQASFARLAALSLFDALR